MPTQAPPVVDALPASPNILDEPAFVATMNTWLAAHPNYRIQLQALAANCYANANDAYASAGLAAGYAGAAAVSAANAQASATSAAALAGAAAWVSGNNYTKNTGAISQIDFYTYRCQVAGVSVVDPKNDPVKWVLVSNVINPSVIVLSEQQANGVGAGDAPGANQAFTVARNINTVLSNGIAGASLSGGQVTLPAGTYNVTAHASAYNLNFTQLSLYSVTDASVLAVGIGMGVNQYAVAVLTGRIVLTAQKVIQLRQWARSGNTIVNALGSPVSSGLGEVYAQLTFEKVA